MTVASSINKTSFLGSNSAGPFPFGFKFYQNEEIIVVHVDSAGTETVFAEGTNYTLTGAGLETGGTINLSAILATGDELVVSRVLDIIQETAFINQGAFYPVLHETAFDKLTMMIQQVNGTANDTQNNIAGVLAKVEAVVPESVVSSQLYAASIAMVPGNYNSLEEARTAPLGTTIVVASVLTQAQSNISAPFERALEIRSGGSIANSTTFTINGPFTAGNYQVFTGTGAVKFGAGSPSINPYWWGAVANNSDASATTNTLAFNKAVQSNADATNHEIKVVVPPGTYYIAAQGTVPYNDGIWDDSASAQPEPVGVAIPKNVTLDLRGVILKAKGTDYTNYAILASFKSSNVHIIGGTLIGERDTHIGTTGEWGHGIFFRDTVKSSITDTDVSDCWGDGVVIGAMASGTGSQDVVITNVFSDNNRRQGMSITGGQRITVLGGRYSNSNGTTPKAGIDIEPNTANFATDIRIIGAHFEGNQYTIQAYKVNGLVIDGCTFANNIFNFPDFRDRVYNATVTNNVSRAGALTGWGVAWEDTLDLQNIYVAHNIIDSGSTSPVLFILAEGADPWSNVVWESNKFIFSTAEISNLNRSPSVNTTLKNNEFILPPGFNAASIAALGPIGGRANVANISSPSYGNTFRNNSTTLTIADITVQFTPDSDSNRGNIAEGWHINYEAPAFSNSWNNVASKQPVAYYRTADGRMHLAGSIGAGTTTFDTLMMTIPVAFAPLSTVTVGVVGLSSTTATAMTLQIKADGGIYTGRGVANTDIPLDGVSWIPGY